MRREIQTDGGPIVVSGDPDGPVMLHTPPRRPAVLSPDEARQLGQALGERGLSRRRQPSTPAR